MMARSLLPALAGVVARPARSEWSARSLGSRSTTRAVCLTIRATVRSVRRSSLAADFTPKPLPKLAARTVVAELVAGRFENAASLADDARLVVNMSEALHRKIKLRAVERGITIREYVLGLLANDGLL